MWILAELQTSRSRSSRTGRLKSPVDPLGISQLALITKCRIEADAMVARNAMDAACSRVPSYDEHHFFALATKLDNLI